MVGFLDLLFPKRCVNCGRLGGYLCRECFSKIEYVDKPVCPVCQRQAVGGKTHPGCRKPYGLDGLVVAARYRGAVKRAIAKVKYKWAYDIGNLLVDLLVASLWKFDLPKDVILVPVPLHRRREKWRGFNQSRILAKSLAKKFGVDLRDVLIRTRETQSQVGLKRDERKKNVKGAFALRQAGQKKRRSFDFVASRRNFAQDKIIAGVIGENIILVDDVYTSGATINECAKVLKKAGAKSVWAMAVALG
ncbi:hypothetical protein A3I53_00700 [Candidatus Curtissbacteria bacterium RIFCSPLOWO2_02_FULL_40_13b]|uniref:Double zinc ribbon domain-containing protein n=1 Tax=Candidatus Curtissbacteria bacterium RIFCSPLOWO2_02_FULL_40_13b TaxID=1797733 RepID=A0A1F5HNW3_9BACT|nr:MAG: hypothetical protein A3I53_00700 [Candidatus Curtissbacteria bacterium RIFCSPLOWO2_02_FULL_40_13b]